ncbi:MAG: S1C family serine protease [Treponema sp.]|jgi:S1-C subfamily serine protease|nr:S1C family serine protease [Treponema sp.]
MINKKTLKFTGILLIILNFLSCISFDNDQEITSTRSTSSIRLENIQSQIDENPIAALNLIGIYKKVYQVTEENKEWPWIFNFEQEAISNLSSLQKKAIQEERWDDAISFRRSLNALGIADEMTGTESDFLLADAKKRLSDGDTLGAFITAVKSHELKALDFDSAMIFLQKSVAAKQRRAAAFFLSAAGGNNGIPQEFIEYAKGRDSVADMIKGVATVIVDRGIKVERGRGINDRVLGSAFFVDSSGLLITNYHVISSEVDPKYKGYSKMYIRMGDAASPRYPARVIGWDKALDLALIKTEYESEFIFSLVDRVIPQVGDTIIAIGSPVGLEKTVTQGIVSSLSRRFLQIGDVIQIDASVNHGNSGGPVVDTSGRLVGIVFAGIEHYQGLNFAVPAERLAAALPAMIKGGKAKRSWLGLSLGETYSGAEIIYIAPNTQAEQHKVSEGSVIKSVNGKVIRAEQGKIIPALQEIVFQTRPGELVALETADAQGEVTRHIIMTTARPDLPLFEAAKIDKRERIAAPLFGMVLTPLKNSLFSSSYIVKKVVRGSITDEAGISEDDPISITRFRIMEDDGYAVLDISVKKRRMGYLETSMQLPAWLDSPDTL